jgi:hypothetical protein
MIVVQVQIMCRCRTGADTEVQRCTRGAEIQRRSGVDIGTAEVQICRYGGVRRCWGAE